jgi:uncharacterized membrane protein HdeD (DUF308 family)
MFIYHKTILTVQLRGEQKGREESMKAYSEYWIATMVRGLLAIVAGTGILFFPEMAATLLLLPFAILISILCLAAYGTIDSAIVLTTSFMVSHRQPGRLALRAQGICGALVGVLLFALVYDRFDIHWFLYLAAFQAAATAVAEFIVARETAEHHAARWCYGAAIIAGVSAVALLFGWNLTPREFAWLLYGYLVVFGFNLFALSARMLFAGKKIFPAIHA